MLGGNNPLLLRCDQWVAWIWPPRLQRCRGILVRDNVVPIGCDQMLSFFVWHEAGTLRFRSELLRPGSVMTSPSLTKVILAPDFYCAEGQKKKSRNDCDLLPGLFA